MGLSSYFFIIIILFISIWIIIAMLWRFIRGFFHNNYSFFDIFFMVVYFAEQFVLILLLEYIPNKVVLWVSLFALIVVTTASLQKLRMDSRDKKLRELNAISENLLKETKEYNLELINENEELKNMQRELTDYISRKSKK